MGWSAFARKYPATARPKGTSFNCTGAHFGNPFASYRNVLQVIFCEEGIYVYAFILFRAFHPPFLIPWEKIARLQPKKLFWTRYHNIEVQDGPGEISLTLSADALREYERFKPPSLPVNSCAP